MGHGTTTLTLGAVIEAITALMSEPSTPEITASSLQPTYLDPSEGLPGVEVREFTDSALISAVMTAESIGRYVDALRVELASEVAARTSEAMPSDPDSSLAHRLGFKNARSLLQQTTGASGRTISRRLKLGKICRTKVSLLGEELPGTFPHLGEAFFSGQVHIDTAEVVSNGLNSLPPNVPFERLELAEKVLLSHASGIEYVPGVFENPHEIYAVSGDSFTGPGSTSFTHLRDHADVMRIRTSGWLAALDQEGSLPKEEQIERRFLRFGPERNGLVPLRGALIPEVAAKMRRAIDAISNPRSSSQFSLNNAAGNNAPDSDQLLIAADGTQVSTEPLTVPKLTHDQKCHDAFATLVNIGLKHRDMPSLGGEAVSLTIQVTQDSLLKHRGNAWYVDAYGELAPTSLAAARHAACVGSVLKVTEDDQGRILGLETTARIFNAQQRKAIMARDGGCIIPGCNQSAIWCEIHHVHEHAQGGKTHTDNGVLLCWFHHRYLDQHGWQIRMQSGIPIIKAPAWLDPYQEWRIATSSHKPPRIEPPPD